MQTEERKRGRPGNKATILVLQSVTYLYAFHSTVYACVKPLSLIAKRNSNSSLVALGGMRGGQPISPNAYSGRMRNLANSVLCIEARPTSQPGITSPVGKSQYTTVYITLQYITGYYSILQYFKAIYMYPAIMQLTNLFPVGTVVAGCVIGWSHTAHPQTPGTHCSAPSPWHPQGPMGLSPDGWSSSTHHRLQPSPPYQLPCAQRESIEFPEY